MHLRSERLESGQGSPVTVVFEAGCESSRPFKAHSPGKSDPPAMIGIRSVQGPAKGGIEIDLNSSETLFQNGQDSNAPGIRAPRRILKCKLNHKAKVDRQMPGARNIEMRNQPPTCGFERATGPSCVQLHDSERDIVCKTGGELVSVMKCTLSGGVCSLCDVVHVAFKRKLTTL